MHDADTGRHDLKAVKGLHAPFEELITRLVALEFSLHIPLKGVADTGIIDLNRVIDHQIDRHQRLNQLGVFVQRGHRRTHGRQIDQQGYAGKILQDNPGHGERNFCRPGVVGSPAGEIAHVAFLNTRPVVVAQHRFEHDADADRQARYLAQAMAFQLGQGVKLGRLTVAQLECFQAVKKIVWHDSSFSGQE